jgi:hypothetical protein
VLYDFKSPHFSANEIISVNSDSSKYDQRMVKHEREWILEIRILK